MITFGVIPFLPFFSFLLFLHDLYLGGVGIVGQELAELQGDDLLDEVVLVDVLEVAADVLHEGRYLLLVDVGLHYLVHHLVELLLADFLGRGDGALLELLAYLAFYGAYLVLFAHVDDAQTGALLAGAACAP